MGIGLHRWSRPMTIEVYAVSRRSRSVTSEITNLQSDQEKIQRTVGSSQYISNL
jgi:hypothetical protein